MPRGESRADDASDASGYDTQRLSGSSQVPLCFGAGGEAYLLQPRVHGLTLKRQHAEDALMDSPQRLASHESFQRLEANRELTGGQRSFSR